MKHNIVITYRANNEEQKIIQTGLREKAEITNLFELSAKQRLSALKDSDVILSKSFARDEIESNETGYLEKTRLIQLIFAGANNVPFANLPEQIIVASNVGAFAKPLAEHVLAMTLCLAKSILPKHLKLAKGEFKRLEQSKELRGGTCGIIGMGGNGEAIAHLMRSLSMKVMGINRSAASNYSLDFIGSPADMDMVLKQSDVIVLTVPLTKQTLHLISRRELQLMKPDTILINVARGKVIDQEALYEHLLAYPSFRVGIDTWWSEPGDPDGFKLDYPFFELPNLIGSPHNADDVPGATLAATKLAVSNIGRFLKGDFVRGVVDRTNY